MATPPGSFRPARQDRPGSIAAGSTRTGANPPVSAGAHEFAGDERVPAAPPRAAAGGRPHRDYARWRSRQIAYGRWHPWGDAATVLEHVRALKRAGATDRAIAHAASVSVATVHRLQHGHVPAGPAGRGRVSAVLSGRLLAVTPAALAAAATRRGATGSRRRLQALTAMGHPGASLARYLNVPPATVWNLQRGRSATVSPELDGAIRALYDRIWNLRPPERTGAERRAAAAARARAAAGGWPAPAGLDDDHIDDPAFRPRSRWRPAAGVGVANLPARPGHQPGPGDRAARASGRAGDPPRGGQA